MDGIFSDRRDPHLMKNRWGRVEQHHLEQPVPNIWRIPVPLAGHSIGHVNVYALVGSDSVTLIDAGWGNDESWAVIAESLTAIGSSIDAVRRVLLTHFHPDHCGLAGEFQRRAAIGIGMHPADAGRLDDRFFHSEQLMAETLSWLARAGAPDDAVEAGQRVVGQQAPKVKWVRPDHLIADGESLDVEGWDLHALHTPGHTPGHLCFYERTTRTLFAGDHVLTFINTSPGYRPHSSPNPVGDYLGSFERLRQLDVGRVLPGHQSPFEGLVQRLDALYGHHKERLAITKALIADGYSTAWDVTSQIPRSRAWSEISLPSRVSALGETFGHMVHLAAIGEAESEDGAPIRWTVAR